MSAWDAKLIEPSSPREPMLQQVHALFQQQRATWELFRNGEAALSKIKSRILTIDDKRVIVQANPGRSSSTNAKVDPASVAKRPCFLCPDSLPPLERGIAFGNYIMLPNPFPILKHHMTIALRNHEPQQLDNHIEDLLAVTRALGPEMFVIYNGPRCGASAPDHMHFQACVREGVPLFEQLPLASDKDQVVPLTLWGRNLVVCSFGQASQAQACIQSVITALKDSTGEKSEPMMNIVALFRDDRYIISIFPRARHRSACYFAEPKQQIAISPAAIEMAGIVVVANMDHFDRVNENVVLSMYKEVTLGNDLFSRLVEAVT
jgi:ATP adenylyltransferase/5',5'''-P-1,P-4-tetraphosphate phosphorylase II